MLQEEVEDMFCSHNKLASPTELNSGQEEVLTDLCRRLVRMWPVHFVVMVAVALLGHMLDLYISWF